MTVTRASGRGLLTVVLIIAGCAAGNTGAVKQGAGDELVAVTLPDLQGRKHDLAALRGQVVLLDFWATWCEPCKRGLPVTEALWRAKQARGLAAFAVSADENPQLVPAFVAAQKLGLPVLLDPNGVVAERLGGSELPYVVLIDRRGRVRAGETGSDAAAEARIAAKVTELLGEPAQ